MKIKDLKTEDLKFTDFETKKNQRGEEFHVMKVYVKDSNGRSKPLILEKKDVSTFSLRKVLKKDGRLSHCYFPIIFGDLKVDEVWIKKFHDIVNFIGTYVNKPEVKKQIGRKQGGTSFAKFDPLKEELGEEPIMFLRVGHHKGKVLSKFYNYDGKRKDPDSMIDERIDANVTMKINSVFINLTNAYLQVSLREVLLCPILG